MIRFAQLALAGIAGILALKVLGILVLPILGLAVGIFAVALKALLVLAVGWFVLRLLRGRKAEAT
ncbi:MAG: hypothetical protein GWO00_05440 [Gemmatimonadetes bacterium]|nr:hypothetical protein [Gemmatimonadota bacterium]NIR77837.1 hypothetical protein [Gemmatimonadota bacterium]NIT86373.1 hypothetical protein [Gemmatimonadota bacterium]NIU30210.1 hypothetical protein [Gemmatimonadota bacterium]NIV60605.1 hypothetical protein [Gemmatimonadota bacterium]